MECGVENQGTIYGVLNVALLWDCFCFHGRYSSFNRKLKGPEIQAGQTVCGEKRRVGPFVLTEQFGNFLKHVRGTSTMQTVTFTGRVCSRGCSPFV